MCKQCEPKGPDVYDEMDQAELDSPAQELDSDEDWGL